MQTAKKTEAPPKIAPPLEKPLLWQPEKNKPEPAQERKLETGQERHVRHEAMEARGVLDTVEHSFADNP
ncbi:MAG: hypothetical protein KAG66_22545, partial [Methylococcales bacterium]|nr:hypothetical protein [Methylococcales bacterium]